MLENLMSSPIAWAVSSILTVFSTVFAIYTWIAGKKRKQLSVSCKTNEIIIAGKSNIDKLQIRYDDQDIADLSCTNFYVWNNGNTVLNAGDIVNSKPLCIKSTGDAVILSAEIVRVSEETNNFAIKSMTDQMVEMSFDYVDHGEGFVLQILHTGKSRDLEVACKIIGGSEIKDKRNPKKSVAEELFDFICEWLPLITILALSIPAATFMKEIQDSSNRTWHDTLIMIILLILPILGGSIGIKLVRSINQKLRRDIPYSLTK